MCCPPVLCRDRGRLLQFMLRSLSRTVKSVTFNSLGLVRARMSSTLEQEIVACQDQVQKQGDTVRSLKALLKDGKIDRVRPWVWGACDASMRNLCGWPSRHRLFSPYGVGIHTKSLFLRCMSVRCVGLGDYFASRCLLRGPGPSFPWRMRETAMSDRARIPGPLAPVSRMQSEVDMAIEKLKELKLVLDAKQKQFAEETGKTATIDKEAFRNQMVNVLERR